MSDDQGRREWLYLRIALGVVALVVVADIVGWKVHDVRHPRPTRLERTVECLEGKGVPVTTQVGDPLAASAGAGSLTTTIEGNAVTVSLASSQKQAAEIERYYHDLSGDPLAGRLERRDRSVYLWQFTSSPTQRQAMYDCQF